MNKRLTLAILASFALAACQPATPDTPPLAGTKIGGPFALVSETGTNVTQKDFEGQYRLMYFGYTFCPDVCPVDVQKLMQGFSKFEKADPIAAAKLVPMFITIDPQRDTPAILTQFTNAFHPRLIGLTGTAAQIEAVAKTFAVVYQKGEGTSPTAYLMDHSRTAILFGPKGEPLAIISNDGTPDIIAGELARWVK